MDETFVDIRITGKPDSAHVKAGSKSYTYRFSFPLSTAPPQRWNELLVQEWVYRIMPNPRHIWIHNNQLVIDCSGRELALILAQVGEDIHIVNRKYRNEVESQQLRTAQEKQQAIEEKRLDDAELRKVIDALTLPN